MFLFFGNNLLEMYVHDIEVGTTALDGEPEVVNETSATALVNGNSLLGPVSTYLYSMGKLIHFNDNKGVEVYDYLGVYISNSI